MPKRIENENMPPQLRVMRDDIERAPKHVQARRAHDYFHQVVQAIKNSEILQEHAVGFFCDIAGYAAPKTRHQIFMQALHYQRPAQVGHEAVYSSVRAAYESGKDGPGVDGKYRTEEALKKYYEAQVRNFEIIKAVLSYAPTSKTRLLAAEMYTQLYHMQQSGAIGYAFMIDECFALMPHLDKKNRQDYALECCDMAYQAFADRTMDFYTVVQTLRRAMVYIHDTHERTMQINQALDVADQAYQTRRANLMPVASVLAQLVADLPVKRQAYLRHRIDTLIARGAEQGAIGYPHDVPYLKAWVDATPKDDLAKVDHPVQRAVDAFVRNVYSNGYVPRVRDQPGPTAKAIGKAILKPLFRKAGVLPEQSLLKIEGTQVVVAAPTMG